MKTVTRSNIYVSMAAMILTAALAMPAAAEHQVPFKGTIQGNDADNFLSQTVLVVTSTGSGNATHLGQFSFTLVNTVNLAQGTETGFAEFTAANGDMIFATIVGSGQRITPDLVAITETFTITGGTGRFEGTEGSFDMQRLGNGATFTTAGSFDGSITFPGAAH